MAITRKYEKFNKEFFKGVPLEISWYDRTGMSELPDERNVKLVLSSNNGHADYYEGYWVSIISKTVGTIDKQYFSFKTYLDWDSRVDSRKDWEGNFHVWENSKLNTATGWYIAIPSEEEIYKMAMEIYNYINLWV